MSAPCATSVILQDEDRHVDVGRAEEIFCELDRELSSNEEHGLRSSAVGGCPGHSDLEKLDEEDKGRFNLRDFLQSSNNANQSAGIKHKHVGVTWDDLEVDVVGGTDFKVSENHRLGSVNADQTITMQVYIGTFGGEW